MSKEVYNVNAIRPAIVEAYKNGNKKAISAKECEALGISIGYFSIYKGNLESLYNALCAYSRIKHTPDAKATEIKAAYEAIFPLWKEAMSNAEKSKTSKDFAVDLMDIEDLLGFVQKFANNSNEENATKVWAMDTFALFRRKVETMLGIKIAKAEVMTNEMRDYLRKEKALINKINKATAEIEKKNAENEVLKSYLARVSEKASKEIFNEQITKNNNDIKALKEKIKVAKEARAELEKPAK